MWRTLKVNNVGEVDVKMTDEHKEKNKNSCVTSTLEKAVQANNVSQHLALFFFYCFFSDVQVIKFFFKLFAKGTNRTGLGTLQTRLGLSCKWRACTNTVWCCEVRWGGGGGGGVLTKNGRGRKERARLEESLVATEQGQTAQRVFPETGQVTC